MKGVYWNTAALYELPNLILEEKKVDKPQPSQPFLLHRAKTELNNYILTIRSLHEELEQSSLPFDTAEIISQKLIHFKRIAAIAYLNIQNYKKHRQKILEDIVKQLDGQLSSLPNTFWVSLSDEEQKIFKNCCHQFSEILKERSNFQSQAMDKVEVMFLNKCVTSNLCDENSNENEPFLYQKGLITHIRRDKAVKAEKEGYLMILDNFGKA